MRRQSNADQGALVLRPRPPFSFAQALTFLRRFPPTLGERAIVGDGVLGAARVDGQTIAFHVKQSSDDVERPHLECDLQATVALSPAAVEAIRTRIGDWLGADDDLRPLYALTAADPPFDALVRRLYGYHQVRFFTPFENAWWAILGQRSRSRLPGRRSSA